MFYLFFQPLNETVGPLGAAVTFVADDFVDAVHTPDIVVLGVFELAYLPAALPPAAFRVGCMMQALQSAVNSPSKSLFVANARVCVGWGRGGSAFEYLWPY